MAANTTHSDYATAAAALGTELNALANNNVTALGTAQDNRIAGAGGKIYADFYCNLAAQGTNRVDPARIELYIAYAVDGTNYDTILATSTASYKNPVGIFRFIPASLAAGQDSVLNVELPPGLWKAYAKNITGQTLAATANSISFRYHSVLTT